MAAAQLMAAARRGGAGAGRCAGRGRPDAADRLAHGPTCMARAACSASTTCLPRPPASRWTRRDFEAHLTRRYLSHEVPLHPRRRRCQEFFRHPAGGPGAGWRPLHARILAAILPGRVARHAGPALCGARRDDHAAAGRGRDRARPAAPLLPRGLCRRFRSAAVVPLVQLDTGLFVQELFHGPTLAFKDVAMQLLGRLFDHALTVQDRRVTIVGATSGDTGSAAIEAFRGRSAVDVVILHPKGRTSEVQRRQMTTVPMRSEHPQSRGRRHIRRLPGSGEGDVRRRRRSAPRCGCRR